MEWVRKLYGTTVGLDTAPLIYFVERHPRYLPFIYPFFEAVERGFIQVVTSTLTLTEVLAHPYRRNDQRLVVQYSQMLLNTRHVITLPVSWEIAAEAARIRSVLGLKTPDSIQLATARMANASAFLTNDRGIVVISGLEVILLDGLMATP